MASATAHTGAATALTQRPAAPPTNSRPRHTGVSRWADTKAKREQRAVQRAGSEKEAGVKSRNDTGQKEKESELRLDGLAMHAVHYPLLLLTRPLTFDGSGHELDAGLGCFAGSVGGPHEGVDNDALREGRHGSDDGDQRSSEGPQGAHEAPARPSQPGGHPRAETRPQHPVEEGQQFTPHVLQHPTDGSKHRSALSTNPTNHRANRLATSNEAIPQHIMHETAESVPA